VFSSAAPLSNPWIGVPFRDVGPGRLFDKRGGPV